MNSNKDERKDNSKNNKGDDNMLETSPKQKEKLNKKSVEKLIENKKVIKCKDGMATIDPSHPDYEFWRED